MLILFQVSLFIGIGLTVIALLLGNLLRPILLELFLMVFGGVGWILTEISPSYATILIITIAMGAGLFTSVSVHHLVIKPFKTAQNTGSPNAEELVGKRASVSETIYSGGFGEIRYSINGNRFASPAKATNGSEIKAGKDVAICWIEEQVFYVASLDDI